MKLNPLSLALLFGVLSTLFAMSPTTRVHALRAASTITASPNPLTLSAGQSQGTTTVTWDGGIQHPYAEVWVKVDDNNETFVVESGKGKRDVTIELGKTYLFKLSDANELLASVTVTAKQQAAPPAGGNPTGGSDADGRIITSGEKKKLDDVLNGRTPKKQREVYLKVVTDLIFLPPVSLYD